MRNIFLSLLFALSSLSGLAGEFANSTQNSIASTSENEPKYKISNMDMRILIRQLNNIEQCIFPDLGKPNYEKIYESWSMAENLTMYHFQQSLLADLVGEQNAALIKNDPASEKYFEKMHEKLNHQKANVDHTLCEEFKPIYEDVKKRIELTIPQVYK